MALSRRYEPPHPAGETDAFGMDFSAIIPAGMTVVGLPTLKIFTNTQPPVAADADWTVGSTYTRGRAVFAVLTGGVPGKDYALQWSATDSRANVWVRTALVLCGPTS